MKGEGMDKVREALAELVAVHDMKRSHAQASAHWAKYQTDENLAVIDRLATDIAKRRGPAIAAAREALSAQPAEPDCWQVSDFDVVDGWSGWRAISYGDLAGYQRLIQNHPGKHRLRPLFAAPQPAPSEPAAPTDWPECSGDFRSCPENEGYGCCGAAPHPAAKGAES